MEDGSRLGRKDDSMLVGKNAMELDVPLTHYDLLLDILSVMINF
jgi:hypothetical protein